MKFGRGQVINHEGEKKMNENDVVIVSVARTPMGSFQGVFKGLTAAQLGAFAINAAVDRANLSLPLRSTTVVERLAEVRDAAQGASACDW